MYGHAGDAYGLISDMFYEPASQYGVVFITNGPAVGTTFPMSTSTAFYKCESDAFNVMAKYSRNKCISS